VNDTLSNYKWWIIGGLGLVLAVGAGVMLQAPKTPAAVAVPAGAVPSGGSSGSLLGALKEELFALETDRLQGKLSEGEYLVQKAALEVVLKRALARDGASEAGA